MSECHNHWMLSSEGLRMMDSGHGGGQLRANRALWDPRRKGLQLLSDRIHWQRWPISFAFQISQFWNERSWQLFLYNFQRQPISSYTKKLSALHQTLYRKFLNLISPTPKFFIYEFSGRTGPLPWAFTLSGSSLGNFIQFSTTRFLPFLHS